MDFPGVGFGGGTVDNGDRPAADDLHDVIWSDDAGRVLIDPEAEQRRVLGNE